MYLTRFTGGSVLLGLCLLWPDAAHAQRRIGIFVSTHAGTEATSIQATATAWKTNGVVDEAFHLDPVTLGKQTLGELREVAESGQSSSRALLDRVFASGSVTAQEFQRTIRPYVPYLPETDFIVVGHSLGGYVARALGTLMQEHGVPTLEAPGFRPSVAVITLGTPHQGIRAAADLPSTFDEIDRWVAEATPPWRASSLATAGALITNDYDFRKVGEALSIRRQLTGARSSLTDFANGIEFKSPYVEGRILPAPIARDLLAPDALLPRSINGLRDPAHYLSIYGTEKDFTPIRASNEAAEVLTGTLGNEKEAYDQWKLLISWYDANVWGFRGEAGIWSVFAFFTGGAAAIPAAEAAYWSTEWTRARNRVKNEVDNMWSRAMNSYSLTRATGYQRVQVCDDGSGGYYGALDFETADPFMDVLPKMNVCAEGQDPYVWYPYTYVATVPTRNDGVMTPSYGTWHTSEMPDWNATAGFGNGSGNHYFTDAGQGGGYNHFEMRRATRAYTWPEEGVYIGQPNPTVKTAEDWLNQVASR